MDFISDEELHLALSYLRRLMMAEFFGLPLPQMPYLSATSESTWVGTSNGSDGGLPSKTRPWRRPISDDAWQRAAYILNSETEKLIDLFNSVDTRIFKGAEIEVWEVICQYYLVSGPEYILYTWAGIQEQVKVNRQVKGLSRLRSGLIHRKYISSVLNKITECGAFKRIPGHQGGKGFKGEKSRLLLEDIRALNGQIPRGEVYRVHHYLFSEFQSPVSRSIPRSTAIESKYTPIPEPVPEPKLTLDEMRQIDYRKTHCSRGHRKTGYQFSGYCDTCKEQDNQRLQELIDNAYQHNDETVHV